MKERKKLLRAIGLMSLAMLLVVGLILTGAGCKPAAREKPMYNVVCGPEGNTGYVVGGGVFPFMDEWTGGKVNVLPIAAGSMAALRNMSAGEDIQGIFTNHAALEQMWTNTGPFAEKPLKEKLYQTWYWSPTGWILVARADSGIRSYSDLVGKTICVGDAKGSYVPYVIDAVKAMGLWDKVENKFMSIGELPEALKTGVVDACISAIAGLIAASPWTEKIALYNDIVVLTMTEEQIAALKAVPPLAFGYAPATSYAQDVGVDKIPTIVTYYGYHFAEDTDADIVYAITKAGFEHPEHLSKVHVVAKTFTERWEEITREGISAAPHVPVHPGAARYYKEIGVWQDNWTEAK